MATKDPVIDRVGLVEEFAAQLDKLRRQAGGLTFRQMAAQIQGTVAASTLCRAVNGKKLPAWRVVQLFVEACGGDVEHWRTQHIRVSNALRSGAAQDVDSSTAPPSRVSDQRKMPTVQEALFRGAIRNMDRALIELDAVVDDPLTASIRIPGGHLGDQVHLLRQLWAVLNHRRRPVDSPASFAQCMKELKEHAGLSLLQISRQTDPSHMSKKARQDLGLDVSKPIAVSTLSDLCNPHQGRLPNAATLDRFLHALGYSAKEREGWQRLRADLAVQYDRRFHRPARAKSSRVKRPSFRPGGDMEIFGSYIDNEGFSLWDPY